ncbi:MAG: hypothetical protein K6C14_04545 [Eubacterium sp.]|nr:hypothetical protein [Eubacterium sp.]
MKIIAYSTGDSNGTEAWSNVPYYLLNALEKCGNEVIRVNILPFNRVRAVRVLINRLLRLFKTGITFERTALYGRIAKRKMLRAAKKHPDADLLFSFDFSNSIADRVKTKTLLFCDWDIKYLIEHIENRTPTEKEQRLIDEQKKVIDGTDYVVTIFPNAYDEMKKEHSNVYYFGMPVNLEEPDFDVKQAADERFEKKRLLFIGKKKYLASALSLTKAVESYNKRAGHKLFIDIIGMDADTTGIKSEYVTHHGYLHKEIPGEWAEYEALLRNAFFFVNTEDKWVGASSVLDTALCGIPCVVNPNDDLLRTFGGNIDFGFMCGENTPEAIERALKEITALSPAEYASLSEKARERVKGFTYGEYVKNIINLISG